MIELDVDMDYLLEDGEPDCVTLNDENGEFESMTFYRGETDAVAFCKRVESAAKERKPLTLFGVNYEAVGDMPFCEQVDRWLHGDAPSECRECADGKYDELTALVDNRELGLENTIIGLHDALIEATCTIVELDAEKAGGMAMAVEYYAHKLRQFGFDVPPTPMEESEVDE